MLMLKPDDIVFDDNKEQYKILKPIARGGMGYVLLVERESDKKHFALKTLPVFIDGDGDHQALINEARLAEKIKHPNVLSYIYFHDGQVFANLPPYIIMELADERTLEDLIDDYKKSGEMIPLDELIALYLKLIDGMEAINKELVHRDIKPANILFMGATLKITDFGIAKIVGDPTRTKSFKGSGTLAFIAPEVFLQQKNTIQMDIYSMGIVFYLLATNQHPYQENEEIKSEKSWKNAHLTTIANPAQKINNQLPVKIGAIIHKMLEKKPEKRFSSWSDIRAELQAFSTLPESPHAADVEKMVSKKLERRTAVAKEEVETIEMKAKDEEKKGIILYQFDNDIIKPAKEFVDSFNSAHADKQDHITVTERDLRPPIAKQVIFRIPDPVRATSVEINLHFIDESDFLIRKHKDLFDEIVDKRIPPILNGKAILAWGKVIKTSGEGFNIVLSESEGTKYGEWFILKNTHSGLARHRDRRPDPFPFELTELKEEIHIIKALHIYNTQVLPYQPKLLLELITES